MALILLSTTALFASGNTREQTLAIIKPDAVATQHTGEIIARYQKAGIQIDAIKMIQIDRDRAEEFYAEHKGKPFFNDLVNFMTSGPVIVMVLSGDNVIARNRELMGVTDPAKAADGTIRKEFGTSLTRNAVHGSDSPASAKREIALFFAPGEILNRL
jgi:nucleoside-diphosphate kinase